MDFDKGLHTNNKYHSLVDSLLFVDAVPVELESRIRELVCEEKRRILDECNGHESDVLNKYIEPLGAVPDCSSSGHMYHEAVDHCARGEHIQALDLEKYSGFSHLDDIDERKGHISVLSEYAQGALLNLELMDRYKESVWLRHLDDLTDLKQRMSTEQSRLECAIEAMNKARKLSNIEWASRIRSLSQEYDDYQKK
uniref:Uncharacterized protein n=2 Tax=Babesia bovis TaxID=5865 RepID=A7AUV2_BABBO|eukprot:XP_001610281.1 hypothetical protein [Babesia bovis T2Bo]